MLAAFKAGELDRDVVVVVRFQGPRANGMPELHKLTPALGVLQDRGFTASRWSPTGACRARAARCPAAIHCLPRSARRRPARRSCATATWSGCARQSGSLEAIGVDLAAREPAPAPPPPLGTGRELFAMMRHGADDAERRLGDAGGDGGGAA